MSFDLVDTQILPTEGETQTYCHSTEQIGLKKGDGVISIAETIVKDSEPIPCCNMKKTNESPQMIPIPTNLSLPSTSRRPRPSADRQRVIVLQLLTQNYNIHPLHDTCFKNLTTPHGASSTETTKREQKIYPSKPTKPGEAYFIINYNWWTRWCRFSNLFFDKEYNAVLKLISLSRTSKTISKQSLQTYLDEKEFLDQKRRDILRLLPPGSFIPTMQQDRTILKRGRNRSNSISSDSSSSESSDSSYTPHDHDFPPINNSELLLYYKDSPMMGGDSSKLIDNISSSKELFYWDWRHEQSISSISYYPLRPYLVRGYHYEVLSREVYAALVSWYGERTPSIVRRVIKQKDTGRSQMLLYPELHLRVENSGVCHEAKKGFPCGACGSNRALYRCRNCCKVYYCGQTCQGSHWVYHKNECKNVENRTMNGHLNNESHSNNKPRNSFDYLSSTLDFQRSGSRQGLMGLNNLGNTCFMNAALQCLSHTTPLTRYFLSDLFKDDINLKNPLGTGGQLANAYEHLVKELWMGDRSSISPTKLKRAIALFAPQFAGSAQHDSQEFLAFLLDGLHEDLNLVRNPPYVVIPDFTIDKDLNIAGAEAWDAYCQRNDSLVMDTFYGQFKSTCVCPHCNRISVSYDAFNHISLEIPQNIDREISVVLFKTHRTAASCRPKRYLIQLPRNTFWRDLKESLSHISGVPFPRLSVCDVHDNEIYEIYDDRNNLANIQPSDTIVAYEIDPYSKSTIHIIATHVQIIFDKFTGNYHKRFVGYPLLTSFDVHHTCQDVWEHIWKQISYLFIDLQNVRVEDARELLEIRLVRKDGSPLDVFPNNLSSNLTKDSTDIQRSLSSLPRYSKAQLSSFLGPDCTERFLFLHLEWINTNCLDMTYPHEFFLQTDEHSSSIGWKRQLQNSVTLERCFEKFTRTERLDQYNQWYCSVCKEHVRAMKTIELWKIPNVLIVHFKRFEYMHGFRREKLEAHVEFPIDNLDMNRFCGSTKTDKNEDIFAEGKQSALYDLFGVVNHYGRMGFGHYTAACRRYTESYLERDWFCFDDSLVQETPQTSIVSSSAYVLFYRRRIFA